MWSPALPLRSHPPPQRASALPLLVVMCALTACRGGTAGPESGTSSARRYTARAEVVQLPSPGRAPAQLTVRHEAIPGFVDRSGAAVGMPAMVMAFDLAPNASAEGLRTGDKVEIVVAVDWSRPLLHIEEVRKLPPGTLLDFGRAGAEAGQQR